MTSFYDVALSLSLAILSFLNGVSDFIKDNSDLFLLILPIGDIVSFIQKTPILSNLFSLIQIR
jgi:hypothetical protein